jgi:AGZA family xanthine/uracil permease-like MFS transporter
LNSTFVVSTKSQQELLRPLKEKLDIYYSKERTWSNLFELLFKIESRGSTIKTEIYAGLIHFLSTAMILAVNPSQLVNAGYNREDVASATALSTGIACLLTGLLANLPFISTPSLATVIYYSVSMRIENLSLGQGNLSVVLLGLLLMVCSIRWLSDLTLYLIPHRYVLHRTLLVVSICI